MTERDAKVMVGAWDHIIKLNSHGAKVLDAVNGEIRDVTLDFYFEALETVRGMLAARALCYDMIIPETDAHMALCVWSDGHVDSGSMETVLAVMDR